MAGDSKVGKCGGGAKTGESGREGMEKGLGRKTFAKVKNMTL